MAEAQSKQPIVSVKPQSDIYTLLVIVAIVALAVAIGLSIYNLMSPDGYGMKFSEIFVPLKDMQSLPPGVVEPAP
jgi:hypothetical protein